MQDRSECKRHFQNNCFNGKVTFTWKDKKVYEGDWVNNKMEGKGMFKWPDGKIYIFFFFINIKY